MANENFPQSPTGQPVIGILNAASETRPVGPSDPMPTRPVGVTAHPSVVFARPADTATYAAKDAVAAVTSGATALAFAGAALVAGGGGVISSALLHIGDTTNIPRHRLHLFSAAPSVVSADNAPFALDADDRDLHLGWIDFGPPQLEGTGSEYATAQGIQGKDYFCAATTLYGRLELLDGVTTPVSAAAYLIRLFLSGLH